MASIRRQKISLVLPYVAVMPGVRDLTLLGIIRPTHKSNFRRFKAAFHVLATRNGLARNYLT